MENRYKKLKLDLDNLGYHHSLSLESLPLVERLVADLKTTTESLQKFMNIAKQAIEERDNLELGAEPYRCDNAKLVKECNELHLRLLQYKEQNERIQKDFKRTVSKLESDKKDYNSENFKLKERVRELEKQLNKFNFDKRREQRTGIQSKLRSSSTSALLKDQTKKTTTFELNSAMALADEKIATLSKEIKKLKEQQIELIETNEIYRCQVESRDREVSRLKDLLEGGRPLSAINKDCCYKNVGDKFHKMQDDINVLKREKCNLENRLKETLAKQHEAMKRALHLAERNKHLEKELKEIDQMALQVEADCNNSIKNSAEKVNRLQDRMADTVMQIQNLERENNKLNLEKTELRSELNMIKQEKTQLQSTLETCLDDKKKMTDKINQFTIIEQDLNKEIDRLMQLTAEQKRRIAELENDFITDKATEAVKDKYPGVFVKDDEIKGNGKSTKKLVGKKKSKSPSKTSATSKPSTVSKPSVGSKQSTVSKQSAASKPPKNTPQDDSDGNCCKGCCSTDGCIKHFRDLLDKEMEYRQKQSTLCIESLKREKDYYMEEYRKLVEDLKSAPNKTEKDGELILKLNEKEQTIQSLKHENKILSEEKYNLMSRLESARDSKLDADGICLKPSCKRVERERDILRADLQRVEEERDYFKQQIRTITENSSRENQQLQLLLRNSEEEIRKVEQEKRDLIQNQGSRRSNINNLEDQIEEQRGEIRSLQAELTHQKTMYNQLKNLHQQTDKALSDTQGQLMQVETELSDALEKIKYSEREKDNLSQEESTLKNDIHVLKKKLSQMDKERDQLVNTMDEKTEEIAALKEDLDLRKDKISSLEAAIIDLRKQLSKAKNDNVELDGQLRKSKTDLENLSQDLDAANRLTENLSVENRRLQDNVSVASVDCRDTRNELEIARRQIEDLKRQLQTYVAEVKRTEDLISQKEIERGELLDQFRNLSQEANILETNNHTLENEASQTKVQLSVALDHAGELEKKLLDKDALIRGYEKQISEMTSQIANMEFSYKQHNSQYELLLEEMRNLKDLCVKLDNEKDALKREMLEKGDQKIQMDRNLEKLRMDYDKLKNSVSRDQNNVEMLEKLLCDARQEFVNQKLLNEEQQSELSRLKSKYEELREKFRTVSDQLDMYQEKALEYSQQNKHLRREIANERSSHRIIEKNSNSSRYSKPVESRYSTNRNSQEQVQNLFSGKLREGNLTKETSNVQEVQGDLQSNSSYKSATKRSLQDLEIPNSKPDEVSYSSSRKSKEQIISSQVINRPNGKSRPQETYNVQEVQVDLQSNSSHKSATKRSLQGLEIPNSKPDEFNYSSGGKNKDHITLSQVNNVSDGKSKARGVSLNQEIPNGQEFQSDLQSNSPYETKQKTNGNIDTSGSVIEHYSCKVRTGVKSFVSDYNELHVHHEELNHDQPNMSGKDTSLFQDNVFEYDGLTDSKYSMKDPKSQTLSMKVVHDIESSKKYEEHSNKNLPPRYCKDGDSRREHFDQQKLPPSRAQEHYCHKNLKQTTFCYCETDQPNKQSSPVESVYSREVELNLPPQDNNKLEKKSSVTSAGKTVHYDPQNRSTLCVKNISYCTADSNMQYNSLFLRRLKQKVDQKYGRNVPDNITVCMCKEPVAKCTCDSGQNTV